jgi:hypothetical protein
MTLLLPVLRIERLNEGVSVDRVRLLIAACQVTLTVSLLSSLVPPLRSDESYKS